MRDLLTVGGRKSFTLMADKKWLALLLLVIPVVAFVGVMSQLSPDPDQSPPAEAAEEPGGTEAEPPYLPQTSVATMIPRLVASLLAVGALLYGCLFGLRRLSRASRGRLGREGYLEVVGSLPLGQRQTVHLVRALDSLLVIGVSREEMRLLVTLPAGSLNRDSTNREAISHSEVADVANESSEGGFETALKRSFRDLISVSD